MKTFYFKADRIKLLIRQIDTINLLGRRKLLIITQMETIYHKADKTYSL